MAVVDLQAQDRQRSRHDPAAADRAAALVGVFHGEAADLVAVLGVGALVLLGDQGVADAADALALGAEVPVPPAVAAHVVHHLGGVILVILVLGLAGRV